MQTIPPLLSPRQPTSVLCTCFTSMQLWFQCFLKCKTTCIFSSRCSLKSIKQQKEQIQVLLITQANIKQKLPDCFNRFSKRYILCQSTSQQHQMASQVVFCYCISLCYLTGCPGRRLLRLSRCSLFRTGAVLPSSKMSLRSDPSTTRICSAYDAEGLHPKKS